MTTPELIKRLNEIKKDLIEEAGNGANQGYRLEFIDHKRKQAKAITAAIRLLAGTKRRKT